jgi:hypothetical protein
LVIFKNYVQDLQAACTRKVYLKNLTRQRQRDIVETRDVERTCREHRRVGMKCKGPVIVSFVDMYVAYKETITY